MAFNRWSYRANRYSRDAWLTIATAQDIKARAARGAADTWEIERIPHLVKTARADMHLSLGFRKIAEAAKKSKAP